MGYYSEVVLALNEKAKALLDVQIAEIKIKDEAIWTVVDSLLNNSVDHKIEHPTNGAILYHFGMIKWYESFLDIGFISDFINKLNNSDYLFIRIGESIDDIEKNGEFVDNPFNIEVISTIQYDLSQDDLPDATATNMLNQDSNQ
ncbi:hypothetical protein [Desulfovibrio litoralis]|uniref:Uncharacterized protein n=1 Tax=Desulfovibrio litoralis DSM 11393 TaxID=1121455 RepID=A0A1M7TPX3_9BACT|nr:hypothetical protein [Desulfovibrio litoralis]SHN72708.1 hypothetical protein SAMN02745728_02341 [Desulfovibrio litoralis DSM 11393]